MGATNNGAIDDARRLSREREKARRDKHKAARDEIAERRRLNAAQALIREAQKARGGA